MTEHLVPLPTVEKISDRIIRILGGNPGKVSANLGTLEAC
jgi:ribonuclease/clavin/mitogillin